MGIFSSIWDRIRGHRKTQAPAAAPAPQPTVVATAAPGQTALPPVDVEAVLQSMAEMKGEAAAGNWRTSIVDLLKLLGLDSSLEARKELAQELGVNAGPHGSAEQNIALSKAVWAALEKNGGKVPASLRD